MAGTGSTSADTTPNASLSDSPVGSTPVTAVVSTLAGTEWRLHRRHGVAASVTAVTVVWCGLLATLPPELARTLVPWILFLDIAALGLFFVPAMVVLDRTSGMTTAHRVSGIDARTVLVVRIGLVAVTAVAAAVALVAVARPHTPAITVAAVLPVAVFFSLVAVVVLGESDSLTTYLSRLPFIGFVLLAPALADRLAVIDTPLLRLSPATGALRLLSGVGSLAEVLWLAVSCFGLWLLIGRWRAITSTRSWSRGLANAPSTNVPAGPDPIVTRPSWRTAVGSYASVDRRVVAGDRLLLLVLAGIPLLLAVLRWLTGPGASWIGRRHGIELAPDLPAVVAFVVVIHVPTMLGSVIGLLFLEDRDAGVLPALATSRHSLSVLVGYRLAAGVAGGAMAVLLGLLVVGVPHRAGPVAVAVIAPAAATLAPLTAMVLAALARDRAQGMAVMKAMGLPLYLPVAWWLIDGPVGWAFVLLPSAWPARAYWADTIVESMLWAVGGAAFAAVITSLLVRHYRRRVV